MLSPHVICISSNTKRIIIPTSIVCTRVQPFDNATWHFHLQSLYSRTIQQSYKYTSHKVLSKFMNLTSFKTTFSHMQLHMVQITGWTHLDPI